MTEAICKVQGIFNSVESKYFDDFINLVTKMRNAQELYAESRSKANLQDKETLEACVDEALHFFVSDWVAHLSTQQAFELWNKTIDVWTQRVIGKKYSRSKRHARLIAAAPDMYDFVKTVYKLMTTDDDSGERNMDWHFVADCARQILDRIEGKLNGDE